MRLGFRKVQFRSVPKGIRAPVVEKSPAAAANLGHHIRVGGGRRGGGFQEFRIHAVLFAGGENLRAERVLPYQAGGGERKGRLQFGKADDDIVGSSARSLGLAPDVGELLGPRIDIDHFHLVHDPVAAREQPAARGRMILLVH
jgi:hypothetical protein